MAVVGWNVAYLKIAGTEVISATRAISAGNVTATGFLSVTGAATFAERVRVGTSQVSNTGTAAGDVLLGNGIYIRARNQADTAWLRILGMETTNVVFAFEPWRFDGNIGFYGTAPIAKQTGVAVSAAGIHAALVALGLIAA